MMLNKYGFAFKLSVIILAITSFIFFVLFMFNYYFTSVNALEDAEKFAKTITYENVNKIENVLNHIEQVPTVLADIMGTTYFTDREIHDLIKTTVLHHDEIYGCAVAYENGIIYGKSKFYAPYYYKEKDTLKYVDLGENGSNFQSQDWYRIPQEQLTAMWSEPYFDEGGANILMTTYSVPFYNNINGERVFRGIITADVSLGWLEEIMGSVKIFDRGFAFLLSRDGKIITHPNKDMFETNDILEIAKENGDENTLIEMYLMLGRNEGFGRIKSLFLNEEARIYYTNLPSSRWPIAVIFPEKELYSTLDTMNNVFFILAISGFLALLVVITTVTKKLTKPLHTLSEATKEIAKGNFDLVLPKVNSNDEIAVLTKSMSTMQKELREYIKNLEETTTEKERYESELRIAHQIQMGMIPKSFPPFPDKFEIEIYATLIPAKEVGGDLYDYFFLDNSHLVLTIGDVSGKGVPASLLMAVTRTVLRAKAKSGMQSNDLVNLINNSLCDDQDTRLFVTYFLAIIDISSGEIDYTNAGHNPPVIISNDEEIYFLTSPQSYPLGISHRKEYESCTRELTVGDKIVFYTDGITESMSKKDEMFSEKLLLESISRSAGKSTKEITLQLFDDVKIFSEGAEQYDDMTVVSFEFKNKMVTN